MSTPPSRVTIVMYHYVRDTEQTAFPAIKAASVSRFRAQLRHFMRTGTVISVEEMLSAAKHGSRLPDNAFILTFDDGYREHFSTVTPILTDAGVSGAFFPPADAIESRSLLDVNRVHFLLASVGTERLVEDVDAFVERHSGQHGLSHVQAYRERWAVANRWDDAATVYVKRMLQAGLPAALRSELADQLFTRYVSADSVAFAEDLYVSVDNLRAMRSAGMHIGSHTKTHRWLNTLGPEAQREEIESSLAFLERIGVASRDGFTIAYPFGGYDAQTIEMLRHMRCDAGFTVHPRVCDLSADSYLEMPRLDTNDVVV